MRAVRIMWLVSVYFVQSCGLALVPEPVRVEAGSLAAAGLSEDISFLGKVIGQDLSGFTAPHPELLQPNEFNSLIQKEVAKGGLPSGDYIGYYNCEKDRLAISFSYAAAAVEAKVDPRKYFLTIRFHELYHWAMCKTKGKYRFHLDIDFSQPFILSLWNQEERMALMLERRYLVEKLGTVAPNERDFILPPSPNSVRSRFPDDPLVQFRLPWDFAAPHLVPAETEDGTNLFVYVMKTTAWTASDKYFLNLVVHRGEYVYIAVFKNGVLFREWLDKGYAGITTDKFRVNPVYQGKWIQVK